MTRILGIDPGLRSTGLAVVSDHGPGMPELVARLTVTDPDGSNANMAAAVLSWIRAAERLSGDIDLFAVEAFAHRAWLRTVDGRARRVPTSAEMGWLVGTIQARLQAANRRVVVIEPGVSKAGYPAAEKFRARLLPRGLRNRHERDAYLVAAAAITVARQEANR